MATCPGSTRSWLSRGTHFNAELRPGCFRRRNVDSRIVSERITRMAWIDTFAKPWQKIVGNAYRSLGAPGRAIEDFLHGEFLGHPLHPVLTHIPVGMWVLAALLDPWGGSVAARAGADLAVAVGVVMAIPTALTGSTDYYPYGDASIRRIGGLHALLNVIGVFLYALSWLCRYEESRDLARFFSYVGFAGVGISGYLGGLLVYEKRIGANHAPIVEDETAPENWTVVAKLSDLQEGVPLRATAGEVPIVLVRRGEVVDALADKCSHQGGPLSEGKLVDGCLECPWHQTRFRLADGQVAQGPSVFAQPKYPVRLTDGNVEVAAIMPQVPQEIETPAGRASMR